MSRLIEVADQPFAIAQDSFLVHAPVLCAIAGSWALHFVLAAIIDRRAYLKYVGVGILAFAGGLDIADRHRGAQLINC